MGRIWALLAVAALSACGKAVSQPEPGDADATVRELGAGFRSGRVAVNGTELHYVRGGSGPNLLLLHGFPEDWSAFRHVMPALAENYSVVAVDGRGIGRSTPTERGYDAESQGEDVAQLTEALELNDVYVVGHDLGGTAGYAFAHRYPERVRGALLLEAPLAGIEPWAEIKCDPGVWHFGFHQTPNLAERLLPGREAIYLREGFLTSDKISDADVERYARAYAAPDHLRAGLGAYRAMAQSEVYLDGLRTRVDVPFVVAGADQVFGPLGEAIAGGMRARGCSDVTVETIADSGHYVLDDQPERVLALIEQYAALR
jgi:pimeloyl-ACP methyl ester carboxylesterase